MTPRFETESFTNIATASPKNVSMLKFVRQADIVAYKDILWNHDEIADEEHLNRPQDAGILTIDPKAKTCELSGSSISLHIEEHKGPQRDKTVSVLQQLAEGTDWKVDAEKYTW